MISKTTLRITSLNFKKWHFLNFFSHFCKKKKLTAYVKELCNE